MRLPYLTIVGAVLLISAEALGQTTERAPARCAATHEYSASAVSDARLALERALTVLAPRQSYLFRASSLRHETCAGGYTFLQRWASTPTDGMVRLLPVQASVVNNTAYPRSVNDGAAWNGVGLTTGVRAGAAFQWRFLHAQIAPEAYHHQNANFDFVRSTRTGRPDVIDPYHREIDYPTRFGYENFSVVSPGQSYIQAAYKNISATFGTENVWIGAAHVYPILVSYTGPGFPHLRLGTQKPLDIGFARLEFQMLFGSLRESEHFDTDARNDEHYFGATMLTLEPKFLPGLYLSAIRAVHDSAGSTGHGPGFYLSRNVRTFFGAAAGGNLRSDNALGAVLVRWVLPESGFEAYAEWGREDTPGGWVDVLREPDWTQAYVLGFQKIFAKPARMTRVYGELIHLGESAPARAGRGFFSYYTHSIVKQGHTNRGQLLGAAIGPGSDAQLVGVDIFSGSGRSAARIERTRYDDDTYYRTFARRWGETRHDAEISLTASRLQFLGPFEVEGGLTFSRRYGRQFIPLASEGADLVENNWQMRFGAGWKPPW